VADCFAPHPVVVVAAAALSAAALPYVHHER